MLGKKKTVLTLLASGLLMLVAAPLVLAYDGGGWGDRDGGYGDGSSTTLRAVSYINPDTGTATANPDGYDQPDPNAA